MNNNIFIPKKINVGFQNRNDTYTKMLAYIIYFDTKGILRKEKSWESWRDKKIDNIIYENAPTEGFVLNKKAGGYSTGWNHRQTYVRVYDPRGFEFEISIANLLYILENTNSIKGKGLEGEFVYGFDGKDLLLMPTTSPDYIELTEFNKTLYENKLVKAKDLKIGATYLTKQNDKWIYVGKFDYHGYRTNGKKYFWFYNERGSFEQIISLSNKIIDIIDETCVSNYADIFDQMEHSSYYSPYDSNRDEYIAYTFEEFKEKIEKEQYWIYFYNDIHEEITIRKYENTIRLGRQVLKKSRWNDSMHTETEYTDVKDISIEELYNLIKPYYKNTYLQNGKFYERKR